MSTTGSADPRLVDDARQQIRGLVQEVEQLCKANPSPTEFYEGFLSRIVTALAAVGGAVWTISEDGRLELAFQINIRDTGLAQDEDAQLRHGKLLHRVRTTGDGALVPPHTENAEDGSGNPTPFLMVAGALKSDQEIKGVVEVFQRPGGRPAVERGYLRFVLQMCELAGTYLQTRSLRHFSDRQLLWTQLETFTRNVHQTLDPRLTAYTIANEGRRLIECDRVTVAIKHGRKCKVEAVSGQETFDKRSNGISMLGDLATAAVATGEPVWYMGDTSDMAPQVEQTVQAYVDESHSKTVAVMPLLSKPLEAKEDDPAEVIGALIIEQIEESEIPESFRQRVNVVTQHSSMALANSLEHNSLFLMPVWRTLGKATWVLKARTLPKTLAVAAVLAALLAALFIVPADFELEGRGTLEPVVRRDVFAAIDGVVDEVKVEHNQSVQKGDVLVELRNSDLEIALTNAIGQLQEAQSSWTSKQRELGQSRLSPEREGQLNSEIAVLESQIRSYESQIQLYKAKQQNLTVRSPIAGKVVTWQVEDTLIHRPVERGQLLLTVADPSQDWELQVHMPENRMGHIQRARKDLGDPLQVTYILATDPGQDRHGEVKEIHGAAEVRGEEGNTVLIDVAIKQPDTIEQRPVATVTAKIHCGRRSIGYVWFHDLIGFVQSRILFRI